MPLLVQDHSLISKAVEWRKSWHVCVCVHVGVREQGQGRPVIQIRKGVGFRWRWHDGDQVWTEDTNEEKRENVL